MRRHRKQRNAKSLLLPVEWTIRRAVFLVALVASAGILPLRALPPQTINYQGRLAGPGGTPVNATVAMEFRLWSAASGGAALWTEIRPSVVVTNGVFNVVLGSVNPIGLPFDAPYYLGVKLGTDPEMTPRQALRSSPYAFRAAVAETATNAITAITATTAGSAQTVTGPLTNVTIAGDTLARLDARLGPVAVVTAPRNTSIATVDSSSGFISLAIGADGLPVIGYADKDNGYLKVAICGNPDCSAGNTIALVDPSGNAVTGNALAIGSDGTPVIAYTDDAPSLPAGHLKVAKCGDNVCAAGNTLTLVDTVAGVDSRLSIAIGGNGFPMISHSRGGDLGVVTCGNASCSSGNTIVGADSGAGAQSAIAIGTDSLALVVSSYFNGFISTKCRNALCTSITSSTLDGFANAIGTYARSASIAFGRDGLPVVAYYHQLTRSLRIVKCANAACSVPTAPITVASQNDVGSYSSMTIGADGNPLIAYYDSTNHDLKFAHCGDPRCSAGNTHTVIDTAGSVGEFAAMALPADGLPVVAYLDRTNSQLKVAKCANVFCASYFHPR